MINTEKLKTEKIVVNWKCDNKFQYLDYQMIPGGQEEQNTCFFQLKGCATSPSKWSPK